MSSRNVFCQPDVKAYYSYVNKAELAIVDSNYKEALAYYQKAFNKASIEGKDVYNAFVLTALLNDTFLASRYLEILAVCGLKKEFISYDMAHIGRRGLFENISYSYDADRQYRWDNDEKLRYFSMALDSIENRDQAIRQLTENKDSIRQVDIANEKELKKLIDEKGFPDFNKVGYFPNITSPQKPNAIWYIVWHRRPMQTAIDEILKKQVLLGGFRPDYYAELLMVRDEDYYNMLFTTREMSAARLEEINKRRAEIYLENMDDYLKKLKYQFRHPTPFYFYNNFVVTLNNKFLSEEETD